MPEKFQQWMRRLAPDWVWARGTGRRNAWEYGAKSAMGGVDYGRIYHRADCARAEENGRRWGLDAVQRGYPILCDCCGQPFPAFVDKKKNRRIKAT